MGMCKALMGEIIMTRCACGELNETYYCYVCDGDEIRRDQIEVNDQEYYEYIQEMLRDNEMGNTPIE